MSFGFEELERVKILHNSDELSWLRPFVSQLSRTDIFPALTNVENADLEKADLHDYEAVLITLGASQFALEHLESLNAFHVSKFGLLADYSIQGMLTFSHLGCAEVFVLPFDAESVAESIRLRMAQAAQSSQSIIRVVCSPDSLNESYDPVEESLEGRIEFSSVEELPYVDAQTPPGLLLFDHAHKGISGVDLGRALLMDPWNGVVAAVVDKFDGREWALTVVNKHGELGEQSGDSVDGFINALTSLSDENLKTRGGGKPREETGYREIIAEFGSINEWVRRYEKRGFTVFGCGLRFDNGPRQIARTLGSRRCREISSVMRSELTHSFISRGKERYKVVSLGVGNKVSLVASKEDAGAKQTELEVFMSDVTMFFGASALSSIGVEPARVKWSVSAKNPEENITNFLRRFRR